MRRNGCATRASRGFESALFHGLSQGVFELNPWFPSEGLNFAIQKGLFSLETWQSIGGTILIV